MGENIKILKSNWNKGVLEIAFLKKRNNRHETFLEYLRLDLVLVVGERALECLQFQQFAREVHDTHRKLVLTVVVEAVKIEDEQVSQGFD